MGERRSGGGGEGVNVEGHSTIHDPCLVFNDRDGNNAGKYDYDC